MGSDLTFTLCSSSFLSEKTNQFDNKWLASTRSDFKSLYADEEDGSSQSTGRKDLDFLNAKNSEVKERKPVPRFRINATVEPEAAAEEKKILTTDDLSYDMLFGDDGLVYNSNKKGTSLDTSA